jgi:hypothetical protein
MPVPLQNQSAPGAVKIQFYNKRNIFALCGAAVRV